MARITLISTNNDFWSLGVRRLSSVLRQAGHTVQTVFIVKGGYISVLLSLDDMDSHGVADQAVTDIIDLVKDDDLIGISTMSVNYCLKNAFTLAEALKSAHPDKWIGMGGFHPTAFPEECIQKKYIDFICRGDGEEALLELAASIDSASVDRYHIKNLWIKDLSGQNVTNPQRPLNFQLDQYPPYDYSTEDMYLVESTRLRKATAGDYKKYFSTAMRIMCSYGCPYACAYCHNDVLYSLDKNSIKKRHHSVDYIINMIKEIIRQHPYFDFVDILDDSFLNLPLDFIRGFSEKYKKEIGLPFALAGVIPNLIDKQKMDLLVGAGLCKIILGIQSGSRRVLRDYYSRFSDFDVIISKLEILTDYRDRLLPPTMDIIVGLPAENEADRIETLTNLNRIPRPFSVSISNLSNFPGTKLTQKLIQEGLIKADQTSFGYSEVSRYDAYLCLLQIIGQVPKKLGDRLVKSFRDRLHKSAFHSRFIYQLAFMYSFGLRAINSVLTGTTLSLPYGLAKLLAGFHPALRSKLDRSPVKHSQERHS
ncbi:MAG: radical SAM protein [Candidatus Omnitrophota bacterium]